MQRGAVRGGVAVLMAITLAACATGAAPTVAPGDPSSPTAPASPDAPPPLIVDLDMDTSDLMALPYLLTLPGREVLAVTVTGTGVSHCPPGSANARAVAQLVGSDVPTACGPATAIGDLHPFPEEWRVPADVLYGLDVPLAASSTGGGGAVDLLHDVISASDRPVEILVLGPLTNIAALLERSPEVAGNVRRLVVMGGAIEAPGNVGDAPGPGDPEWNVWADPGAARTVFASDLPITLVPLDATDDVPIGDAFLEQLAADHASAGANLVYELLVRNRFLVGSNQFFWDQLTSVILEDPDVVTTVDMRLIIGSGADDGRTMRDDDGRTASVAISADPAAFAERFLAGLRRGPAADEPFVVSGRMEVRWDGETCRADPSTMAPSGALEITVTDGTGTGGAAAILLGERATWEEMEAYVAAFRPGDPPPTFAVPVFLSTGGPTIVDVPAGTGGFACFALRDGEITDPVLSDAIDFAP